MTRTSKRMTPRRKLLPRLAVPILLVLSLGCHKVPLADDSGQIDFAAAHYFANEQVTYVFFSLSERTARLIAPQWQLQWREGQAGGGDLLHPYAPIDFSQGVHEHTPVACGADRLCLSYSFRSAGPVTALSLKFLYDKDEDLGLERAVDVANHAAGSSQDAYSALLYGVFDQANQYMQVRVHHNFGSPNDALVPAFGMMRRFQIGGAQLHDIDTASLDTLATAAGTSLLFPATPCDAVSTGVQGDDTDLQFVGIDGWLQHKFPTTDASRGGCFRVNYLDKHGVGLLSGVASGYGRRNPELADGQSLTLLTPLSTAIQLPIVIRICQDDPAAGSMVDSKFFDYQRYILGISGRDADLCFNIGKEAQFDASLQKLLTTRLAAAKAAATDTRDFFFVVLLHELFSPEFKTVQTSIADALYTLANSEAQAVSPRLSGAFVYGSSVNFSPTVTQRRLVLWCPQTLIPQVLSGSAPLADQNCTTTPAGQLDLQVINFVAPLGPLPSLTNYDKYVKQFGDTGTAKSPKLDFYTVPTGVNTLSENSHQVTYFDNERYTIGVGEYAKVCSERLDTAAASFVVRPAKQADAIAGESLLEINKLWLSDSAPGDYKIGIAWEYPFFGEINYRGALNGKIVSYIPYQKSFDSNEILGDPKWAASSWDFGKYVQHCVRYCDNPFFDATGTYQDGLSWRGETSLGCPAPVYPVWPGSTP